MPFARVTVTLPPDLVELADRVARSRSVSRSSVFSQALRAYLEHGPLVEAPGRVAEPGAARYDSHGLHDMSGDQLLAELRRRLGAAEAGAIPVSGGSEPRVDFDRAVLAELCRRRGIRRLALFGSVLTGEFGPDSDVDALVEFEPGRTPGLAMVDIEDELSMVFAGHRVDLVTERSLHPRIRNRVLEGAAVQYGT